MNLASLIITFFISHSMVCGVAHAGLSWSKMLAPAEAELSPTAELSSLPAALIQRYQVTKLDRGNLSRKEYLDLKAKSLNPEKHLLLTAIRKNVYREDEYPESEQYCLVVDRSLIEKYSELIRELNKSTDREVNKSTDDDTLIKLDVSQSAKSIIDFMEWIRAFEKSEDRLTITDGEASLKKFMEWVEEFKKSEDRPPINVDMILAAHYFGISSNRIIPIVNPPKSSSFNDAAIAFYKESIQVTYMSQIPA